MQYAVEVRTASSLDELPEHPSITPIRSAQHSP